MKLHLRRVLALAFLVFLICMGMYVLIVSQDIRIQYINPPDEEHVVPVPTQLYFSKHPFPPDVIVGVNMTYRGTLVAETPVRLHGVALLLTEEAKTTVENMTVSFKHALQYPYTYENGVAISGGLSLLHATEDTLIGNAAWIVWSVAGDFAPSWVVVWKNGTISTASFPETVVNVQPTSELQAAKSDRINQNLTVALTYFALIEGIIVVLDIAKYEKHKPTNKNEKQTNGRQEECPEPKRVGVQQDPKYAPKTEHTKTEPN